MKEKKSNKTLLIIIAIVLLAVAAVVVLGALKDRSGAEDPNAQGAAEANDTIYGDESLNIDAAVDEQLKDYRNIVICGIDNEHRSDVMMIASINTKTDEVTLFNVYRDTYMQLKTGEAFKSKTGDKTYFKCNHAYKYGGKLATLRELNMNMDLNCREIIGMDWEAVAEFIDEVGGVDVNVTPAMFAVADRSLIKKSGYQHLNGEQAVNYLRIRHDATAVQRSERNEDVFIQIFQKVNAMGTKEQLELLEKIIDISDCNMSSNTMTELLQQIASYELHSGTDWPYDWHLYWEADGSYYYFVPETLEGNVVALHEELFGQSDYKVTARCKEISDKLEARRTENLVEGDANYGE